jgi:hypothetical protein
LAIKKLDEKGEGLTIVHNCVTSFMDFFDTIHYRSPFNTILVSLVIMDTFLLMFFLMDSAYISGFQADEPAWYKVGFPYLWHPIKNMVTTGKKNYKILFKRLKFL